MEKLKYSELLEKSQEFDNLLLSLGININPYDRFHQTISMIRKVDVAIKGDQNTSPLVKKLDNGQSAFLHSHLEVQEIIRAIPFLKTQSKEIVRDKLRLMLRGPLIVSEEIAANSGNMARNIAFEINLASKFHRNSLNTKLKDNPDILVKVYKRNYFVQCKRVFHEKSLASNVEDACSQLERDLNNKGFNTYGIIALSVSRIFVGEGQIFSSMSEETAKKFLGDEMLKLIDKYQYCWKKIKHPNIVGVILELSGSSIIRSENNLPAHGTQIDITNVHDNDPKFKILSNDFYNLQRFNR
jgi:hypothetical protein